MKNQVTFDSTNKEELEYSFKFLKMLIDFNTKVGSQYYNDIRVYQEDMFVVIEWVQCPYDSSLGKISFQLYDEENGDIYFEKFYPDGTVGYFKDEESYNSSLHEWEKEHTNWHKTEYGSWVED